MWPILVYAGGWEAVLYLSYIHSSPLPTVSPAGPHFQYMLPGKNCIFYVLGDPEVTANIYCKPRNLPNTYTQNYSTDMR